MEYVWTEKAEQLAKEKGLEERKARTAARFGPDDLQSGQTAQAWIDDGFVVKSDPSPRINELIGTIEMYLDATKYTFNYSKVESLLTEAAQTVEQTARGVRPVNLPADIPFSDSLDEEGCSTPYNYKGDMSPEEYERMMDLYEQDQKKESSISDSSVDETQVITVYQSPDRRHCDLRRIGNNGKFDDTDMPGRRYFLPDGFQVQYGPGLMPRIIDSKGRDAYLIDSDSGYPYLHTIDSSTSHISQNGIPLRPYSESPAELWDEYNTLLNAMGDL